MVALRFITCTVVFVGGLAFLIRDDRHASILMLFPTIGFLPAAIYTAVVLSPIEHLALARDRAIHLVWALPLAGAVFPFVIMIVLALYWGEPSALVRVMHLGPAAALPTEMGLTWGVLWWITGVIARLAQPADDGAMCR